MTAFEKTAKQFDVTVEELQGKSTYIPLPDARHTLCMALFRNGHTNKAIERLLNYNQSRVAQSLRIARAKMKEPKFAVGVYKLQKKLKDESES